MHGTTFCSGSTVAYVVRMLRRLTYRSSEHALLDTWRAGLSFHNHYSGFFMVPTCSRRGIDCVNTDAGSPKMTAESLRKDSRRRAVEGSAANRLRGEEKMPFIGESFPCAEARAV
eukprot:5160363-Pleurochrysis_carterae.AAC.1